MKNKSKSNWITKKTLYAASASIAILLTVYKAKAEELKPTGAVPPQKIPITWNAGGYFTTPVTPSELPDFVRVMVSSDQTLKMGGYFMIVQTGALSRRIRIDIDNAGSLSGGTIDLAAKKDDLAAGASVEVKKGTDGSPKAASRLAVLKNWLFKVVGIRTMFELGKGNPSGRVEANIPKVGTTISAYLAEEGRVYGVDQTIGPVTLFAASTESEKISAGIVIYPSFGHAAVRCESGPFLDGTKKEPTTCMGIIGVRY